MIQSITFRLHHPGIDKLAKENEAFFRMHCYLWDEEAVTDDFKSLDQIVRDLSAHMIQREDIPPSIPRILESLATLTAMGCIQYQIEEIRQIQVVQQQSYVIREHGIEIKDEHAFDKGEDS